MHLDIDNDEDLLEFEDEKRAVRGGRGICAKEKREKKTASRSVKSSSLDTDSSMICGVA